MAKKTDGQQLPLWGHTSVRAREEVLKSTGRRAPAPPSPSRLSPVEAPVSFDDAQLTLSARGVFVGDGERPGLPAHYRLWYEAAETGEAFGQITVPEPLGAVLAALHVRRTAPAAARIGLLLDFPLLAPHIERQLYDRDGGHRDPRRRFELALPAGSPLVDAALAARCQCAACGAAVHPFRRRQAAPERTAETPRRRRRPSGERLYVAVACPLAVSVGCSRGDAAAEAYVQLEEDILSAKGAMR